jgi:hypothetical protein
MLECFKDVGDQCKMLEDTIKGMFDFGKEKGGLPFGTTLPAYEDLKMFAKNECPTLPNGNSDILLKKKNLFICNNQDHKMFSKNECPKLSYG